VRGVQCINTASWTTVVNSVLKCSELYRRFVKPLYHCGNISESVVHLLANMDTDDKRGKMSDTEVEMDDNRASSNQVSNRRVTGAYSSGKVNAPEGSKRHQTY